MRAVLTNAQFRAEHAGRPGLIPVSIDVSQGNIQWSDLGAYHCYEGFFSAAIANYIALRGREPESLVSTIEVLGQTDLSASCLSPSAFIFHAGRCGSTLLARILARSRANLVLGEAPPHNQIWSVIRSAGSTRLYRPLALAMGRKRLPSYQAHIVKFTSFNITQFQTIRAAFPGVPALFLFRNPGPMLESWRREPPGWMGRELGIGRVWLQPDEAVADFLHAALDINERNFRCLDHAELTPENLPRILEFFGLRPEPVQLREMKAEFAWNSKSVSRRVYLPWRGEYQASSSLQQAYEDLRTSQRRSGEASAIDL